ncbi:AP2 domain-containing protein [Listeria booriae]|uniref:AP2 domain-containing protein n=1 Tax=Listeria booriae TaxID=1552123 RepID=UPI0016266F67|nr:AP2 domain-containing protein [Listeria booriae]MBC1524784.1 AP2 domain-containing protein [Listeria booriae]
MNNHVYDLTGQKFGRLTVVSFIRSQKGNALWKCKCECGNEHEALAQGLKRGNVKSCGCLQIENGKKYAHNLRSKEIQKKAHERRREVDFVDGTFKSALTRNVSTRNTSGVKGVHWDNRRKKWQATITLKQKSHFLGRYSNKEDAIKARLDAEEKYFKPILENDK